ncbi:ankyrin repeat domain-containing protein [Silanimonas sp.]|jgi:hypothetical protein|uniref:ankyrin repeat domain-containing protein n=1 Tax=Silanimonas sp. TaxID=1929290 RepID=UPI0022BEA51E|nr:ankyrin repeat domain-containing protein [Silanimonas sp.]MCZ8115060.1 ankyrin repeat domain-containing protein [Silanimonas sp.]
MRLAPRALLLPLLLLLLALPGCDWIPPSPRGSLHGATQSFEGPALELALAVEKGDLDAITRRVESGVDPDTVFSSTSNEPLVAWAIRVQRPDSLQRLLELGADPNVVMPAPPEDGEVRTHVGAMVAAVEAEDPQYLDMLLAHGGDPDHRVVGSNTLLKHAFYFRNWTHIQRLILGGADINARDETGNTILEIFAGFGSFERTYWLLEHGADPMPPKRQVVPEGPDGNPIPQPQMPAGMNAWVRYDAQGREMWEPSPDIIQDIFWHPGSSNPDSPWQRRCQEWLLVRGIERPPVMPEYLRRSRTRFGLPTREEDIPLPEITPEMREGIEPYVWKAPE